MEINVEKKSKVMRISRQEITIPNPIEKSGIF
jgi:hypothetical protein